MTYHDRKQYRKCSDCDNLVLPPRRKCNSCRKSKAYTTTKLPNSNKGRSKRGTCLHKAEKPRTKRAPKQREHLYGSRPTMPMNATMMNGRM